MTKYSSQKIKLNKINKTSLQIFHGSKGFLSNATRTTRGTSRKTHENCHSGWLVSTSYFFTLKTILDYETIGAYDPSSQQATIYRKSRGIVTGTGLSRNSIDPSTPGRGKNGQTWEFGRRLTRKQTTLSRKQTIYDNPEEKKFETRQRSTENSDSQDPFLGSKGYVEDIEGVQASLGQLSLLFVGI